MGKVYPEIAEGRYDAVFASLYGREDALFHRNRWTSLMSVHRERVSSTSPRLFSSPGRTELAGNHTDHNQGRVLAAAVHLDTIAAVTPLDSLFCEIISEGYEPVRVDLSDLSRKQAETGRTDALLRGIAASITNRGGRIGGFTADTRSRVLKGSGLSSSAALEILVASIFNELYNEGRFSAVEMALMGQEAENGYFGKPSGLMDQIACAVGGGVSIDFASPSQPEVRAVKMDLFADNYVLAVVDSGGNHADMTPEYASIPAEMRRVAAELGADSLRDVSESRFYSALTSLREAVGDRAVLRALHFFAENNRVLDMARALEEGNLHAYLDGVRHSGNSSYRFLQNVLSPGMPESQAVGVALALSERFLAGEGACRVHGGGFAGTIQAFVPISRFPDYQRSMESFLGEGCVVPITIRHKPAGELTVF